MILNLIFILPFFALINILFIPKKYILLIKQVSLFWSFILCFYSLYLFFVPILYKLKKSKLLGIQFKKWYWFFLYKKYKFTWCFFTLTLGIDGISIFFIILTTLLIPVCLLVNWESIKYRSKDFTLLLLLLELLLLNVFTHLNLFFFYLFFESVLIPMFLIIGIWGSRQRKIHAVYQFFLYTFFGSIFLLFGIFLIYLHTSNLNFKILYETEFSSYRQLLIWLFFFIGFSIKVPMIPFHIWLPEAHVEAPTTGSILLAGILLKLGTYGFLRFLLPLFPYANTYFTPLVFVICLISIIYGSFCTIRQIDLKKIIAYSSVVHMNFAIIGLFTQKIEGLQGSFFLMISHGIISGSLFFLIGVLYDRYHNRIIYYFGGLVNFMPLFSILFLIFTLSNMGFPGTSGFIGEFLILIALFSVNLKVVILVSLSMVFSAIYSLWLYNRVIFGELKNYIFRRNNILYYFPWFNKFSDLTKREFVIVFPLVFLNILLGIYPNIILNKSYFSLLYILFI
jgi:proton-translocating NADH-quinone oxidoreductase chain M